MSSLVDKIQSPRYEITIPSTKKKAKFRPMFVREERALLSAYESDNEVTMLTTLSDVVEATLEPKSSFGTGLTAFDIEYLFTHIRSKSVDEFSSLTFRCDVCTVPEAKATVRVDLRNVEVFTPTEHTKPKGNIVKLNDRMSVQMKYPVMSSLINGMNTKKEDLFKAVIAAIEIIFIDEDVFTPSEESEDDLVEFVNRLSGLEYREMEQFVRNTPYARIPVTYTCPVCSKVHNKYVRGLKNFF